MVGCRWSVWGHGRQHHTDPCGRGGGPRPRRPETPPLVPPPPCARGSLAPQPSRIVTAKDPACPMEDRACPMAALALGQPVRCSRRPERPWGLHSPVTSA